MRILPRSLPAAAAMILLPVILAAQQSDIIRNNGDPLPGVAAVESIPGERSFAAAGYDSTVILPSAGIARPSLLPLRGTVLQSAWTPAGDTLVARHERGILVLTDTMGALLRLIPAEGAEHAVSISSDGRYAIMASGNSGAGLDEGLYAVALGDGTRRKLRDHGGSIPIACISPGGAYATESGILYDLHAGTQTSIGDADSGVVFSRDNQRMAGWDSKRRAVLIRALPSGEILRSIDPGTVPNALDISPDGALLAVAQTDGSVTVWEMATGVVRHRLSGGTRAVTEVRFPPDRNYLLGGYSDGAVWLWNLASDSVLRVFRSHQAAIQSLAVSPNGRRIFSGSVDGHTVLHYISLRLASAGSGAVSAGSGLQLDASPNPLSSSGVIRFSLPRQGDLSLSMHDATGEEVEHLRGGATEAGAHGVIWNAGGYPAGVYFCRLRFEGRTEIIRVVVMR